MLNRNNRNIAIDSKDMTAIMFRNFSGKPDNFNPNGTMGNFTIGLTEEKGHELEEQGLNVRWRDTPDGDKEPRLKVFVRYENFPPKVYRIVDGDAALLDKESVELLDNDDISDADLIISPYAYEFGGRKGVKAYLYRGYFTVASDQYAERYLHGKGVSTNAATGTEDDLPF